MTGFRQTGGSYPNQRVYIGDGSNLDAFGILRVSQQYGVFDNKQIHTRNPHDWEERIVGAIIVHGVVTGAGFAVGEVITGGTSTQRGTITAVNVGSVVYSTSNGNEFIDGETITGATSGSTAVVTSHNTGSDIVYNYDRSSTYLKVGTANGARVVRQTVRYFPYLPGKGQKITNTGIFGTGKANVKQYMIYGDDLNGMGYCLDQTVFSILLRSSTTGSVVDTLYPQSTWNIDKLDGNGPSGLTLDITKVEIQEFDFQWLGSGRNRFSFSIGGQLVEVHEINHANEDSVVYMKTPTLPIRYEIINTGVSASSTTLEQICSSVCSEGGYSLPGQEFSVGSGVTRVAVTARRPFFAIRLKSAYPSGEPNRRVVRFLDFAANAKTNDAYVELVHVHDPISITATWSDADSDSGVEFSTDISAITAEHFHRVQIMNVPAGSGATSEERVLTSEFVSSHSYLTQNFESNNSQLFVLYATAESGTTNILGHISWVECE